MTTNSFSNSNIYKIYDVVQNSMTLFPKQILISFLRHIFSKDKYYKYVKDEYGFPKVVDHTDLPREAGLEDNSTTRILITDIYRMEVSFFPAIFVRSGGSKYVPISLNREAGAVQYKDMVFEDGYGKIKTFKYPKSFIFAGAWEGSINLDIRTKDIRSRDELVDIVALIFSDLAFNDLVKSGIVVKDVSIGSPAETEDYNDKIFSQTITLQIRTEWRREVPISNVIEIIKTSVEFGDTSDLSKPPALNLTINNTQTFTDFILSL